MFFESFSETKNRRLSGVETMAVLTPLRTPDGLVIAISQEVWGIY